MDDVWVPPRREGENRRYYARIDFIPHGDWRAAKLAIRMDAAFQVAIERDNQLNPQERAALGR